MNKIVAFIGFAGSGKDTAGKFFMENGYIRYSFAKPLKDAVSVIFGWDREMLEGGTDESRAWREQPDLWWEEKLNWQEKHPGTRFTPRVCLQYFGTDTLRMYFDDNIWLLCMENWLRKIGDQKIVLTDCRFVNEINCLRSNGAKIIRIKRGDEPSWYPLAEKYNIHNDQMAKKELENLGIHCSERDWIGQKFDYCISNDGTLKDLTDKLTIIL